MTGQSVLLFTSFRSKCHHFFRFWMDKCELPGCQHEPATVCGIRLPILAVPDDRHSGIGQLDSDLMMPACKQFYKEFRITDFPVMEYRLFGSIPACPSTRAL